MTAPHSISDGSAEALEYLSVFADSGYYGLSNVQVRAICAALRTPALPSGEVEAVAWRVYCTNNGATGYLYTEALPFEPGPGVRVRREPEPLFASSPQAQTATHPFSRWANIIESASLTISPKGSDALNALAAEVRAGGAAQAPRQPTEAMLDAARDWSREKYGKPIGNDAATGCWLAMHGAATLSSTNSGDAA